MSGFFGNFFGEFFGLLFGIRRNQAPPTVLPVQQAFDSFAAGAVSGDSFVAGAVAQQIV
jgi:hypothetical protein